ncbi:MAG: hypothetical protein JNM93_13185 [Bacteriovoracaceae bacterium]|nr:hypothetical protein [Bacteriovoracaceae bacterium]
MISLDSAYKTIEDKSFLYLDGELKHEERASFEKILFENPYAQDYFLKKKRERANLLDAIMNKMIDEDSRIQIESELDIFIQKITKKKKIQPLTWWAKFLKLIQG